MPTSNWTRTDNFFKTAAERSYIGAKGIFTSLDTKLYGGITDPDILAFYNTYHPLNINHHLAHECLNMSKFQRYLCGCMIGLKRMQESFNTVL